MKIRVLLFAVLSILLVGCETDKVFSAKVVNESMDTLSYEKEFVLKSEIENILMLEVLGAYRDAVFFSNWVGKEGIDYRFYDHLYQCKELIKDGNPPNTRLWGYSNEEVFKLIESDSIKKASEIFYSKLHRVYISFGTQRMCRSGKVYIHDIIVNWWCDEEGDVMYIYGMSESYPPTIETVKKGKRMESTLDKEIDSDYIEYVIRGRGKKSDLKIVPEKKVWRWAKRYYNKLRER